MSEKPNWETGSDLLQVVLDSLTYPLYVVDAADYRIRLANAAARRMHTSGAATCHALLHRQDTPCHTEDHPCPLAVIRQTGRPTVVEHVHYDDQGNPRHTEVHGFPIFDEAGNLAQIVEYCVDISDRKRVEESLRRGRLLSDYSRDAILFIRRDDGRILEANQAAIRTYGYDREQLLARTIYDLRASHTHAITAEQMTQAEAEGVLFETVHRRRDGSTFPVEVSSQGATIDGSRALISVIRDITQRQRLEDELRHLNQGLEEQVIVRTEQLTATVDRLNCEVGRRIKAEGSLRRRSQMLEGFFQHTITPLAFLDDEFTFIRVNEAYARADGKDPEYFVGKNHFDLYPDKEVQAIFEQVVQTKRSYRAYARSFNTVHEPQRDRAYWNWQITPLLDEHGQVEFLVFNLENVTEQQQALQEVQARAQQLQQLTLELSQAEDRERKRLAELLHDDLQQMLAAAKFQAGLLGNRVKNDEDVHAMARQVKDLLAEAIDKSRSLSHELSPPVLGLSNLCETFEWLAEHVRTKHGLTVRVESCDPIQVHSEPLKAFLFKAAQEMLFNVVKHAQVKEARLRLRLRRGSIRLSVVDQGQGFDPQTLGKGGFGLLSVRERVKLLGGRMRVISAPGKGSAFLIRVPAPQPPVKEEATPTPEPSAAKVAAQKKRREQSGTANLHLLLVDDHKIVREGLEAMLIEETDIEVVGHAGNGREAVELAHRLQPDVIVMDVSMPIMTGDEATRRIKRDLPHIRIVALSMFDDPRTAERMREAGAVAYLLKTAPSEELLAAIRGSEAPALTTSHS